MSERGSGSIARYGGPGSLDPTETLRLLKAYMAITQQDDRERVIALAERLAAKGGNIANPQR